MIPHHPTHPEHIASRADSERQTCTPDDQLCIAYLRREWDQITTDSGSTFWECTSTLLGAVAFDDDAVPSVFTAREAMDAFGPVWVQHQEIADAEEAE